MKHETTTRKFLSLLILVTLIVTMACGLGSTIETAKEVGQDVINDWETGVNLYTDTEAAWAKCELTTFTEFSSMTLTFKMQQGYNTAVVDTQQAWSSAFNDAAAGVAGLKEQQGNVAPTNEQGHRNLGELDKNGMTPANIAGQGFTLMVNAVQQAQAIAPDPSVTLAAMDTVQEGYNHINFKCEESIDATTAYNNWAHGVTEAIELEVAHRLGIEYLPKNLPLYSPPAFPNPAGE
jgi:hypothetical protein